MYIGLRSAVIVAAACFVLTLVCVAGDKKVNFETDPTGAQVEVNGSIACTTPCSIPVPSYYFGGKRTAFSKHGVEPITVRLSKEGYAPKTLTITTGPIHWKNLYGNNLYDYYIVSSTDYHVRLDSTKEFFEQSESAPGLMRVDSSSIPSVGAALTTEDVVKNSIPAVVVVSIPGAWGSGFFVSPDGVIVTNAHVIGNQQSVTITLGSGKEIGSTAVYVDADRDLALVKIPGNNYPYLKLSRNTPNAGADVIAIGSPGAGATMLTNTVTKGIVSAVRHTSSGTWIQTDAALNHGNSGGPLLNRNAEVVGVNTLKAPSEFSGLNFSLSTAELASLVRSRFGVELARDMKQEAGGTLSVTSTPTAAEVEVDGAFVGNTPSELPIPSGEHSVRVTKKGFKTFERKLRVLPGAKQAIAAELEPEQK